MKPQVVNPPQHHVTEGVYLLDCMNRWMTYFLGHLPAMRQEAQRKRAATRDQRRLHAAVVAMKHAPTQPFRDAFPAARDPQGLFIIPVLPDDTINYLLDRLAETPGGSAVLVMPAAGGQEHRVVALTDRPDVAGGDVV